MSNLPASASSAQGTRASLKVVLANPLAAGLAHYTQSLAHVLSVSGVASRRVEVLEPSSSGRGKVLWLGEYLEKVQSAVRADKPDALMSVWPAIGYWDLVALKSLAGRRPVYLVMHDPEPLVHARGYGRTARLMSRRVPGSVIVAHSREAARIIARGGGAARVIEVLHPMLVPRRSVRLKDGGPVIRVLGQYKADRDVGGLQRIAADAPENWRLEVVGRGWPTIEGWVIKNEFVAEDQFDALVRTSDAVLIPYSRFFQSGVAVRALEWTVPVVGPARSSLRIALGEDSPWLVRDGDWMPALTAAVEAQRDVVASSALALYERVIKDWSGLLESATEPLRCRGR